MPKVSGLSQYNIACSFHGHLNKILLINYQNVSPKSHQCISYLINFKRFTLNSARHQASQVTLPSGPGRKVTGKEDVLQFKPEYHTL